MSRCPKCQETRRSSAYEEGYEAGYRAGLESGYEAGFTDGLNILRQSRSLPNEEYALGFNDGFNAGAEAGYAQGYTAATISTDRDELRRNNFAIGVSYPTPLHLCSGSNCSSFTLRTRNGVLRFDGNRWSRISRN